MTLGSLPKISGVFIIALLAGVAIGLYLVGGRAVEAVVVAARAATGGGLTAMAVVGWVFSLVPFAFFWAGMLLKNHARTKKAAIVCFSLSAMLVMLYGPCWPMHYNSTLAEAVTGYGGGAFVAGIRNGLLAGCLASVLAPAAVFNGKLRARFGDRLLRRMVAALTVVMFLFTLAAAIVLAP